MNVPSSLVRELQERTDNHGPAYRIVDFFRSLSREDLDGVRRSAVWAQYLSRCGSRQSPEFGRNEFYRRLESVHRLRVVTVKGVRRYRLLEDSVVT